MIIRYFLLLFVLASVCVPSVRAEEPLDFTRDIRPILSNKCFHCHGPDGDAREGSLRLDTKNGAFAETDSSLPAIVPGKPEDSELFRRLVSDDDSEQMPPAETGAKLKPKEIELIRKWIKQGGKFAGHWSYEKIIRHDPPQVKNKKWVRNEIDAFILARLEAEGLSPQVEAKRETIIRRLTLDLTGLPPTLEQVDAFLKDDSKNAYEKVVDRLLASPAYGEHWARMWLDLARYADSAGYADDPPRTIWAYRDYVIKSLNENKRFDQFSIEQLAGDLLPNPTQEQLIATAFHRNTLTNSEGGTDDEEFRNAAIIDRVNTTFAVWMGTTITCANCHTHKFDPISQKEYFQIFAILNNTEDSDKKDERPLLQYYTEKQKQQKKTWQQQLVELQKKIATPTPAITASQINWETRMRTPLQWSNTDATQAVSSQKTKLEIRDHKTVFVKQSKLNDSYEIHLSVPQNKSKKTWQALQIKTIPDETLPGKGAGHGGGNFVITRVSAAIVPTGNQPPLARYVRVELPGKQKILSLAEVEIFSNGNNVATAGIATQSSNYSDAVASRANDGNTNGDYHAAKSVSHTAISDNPWWEIDLKTTLAVNQIVIWNRIGDSLRSRLDGCKIIVMDEERKTIWQQTLAKAPELKKELILTVSKPVKLVEAFADFSQPDFDAAFVLDTKEPNKRGWAVAGKIDQPHTLTLIPAKPFQLKADEQLVVTIEQNSAHKNHTLGQFQILLCDNSAIKEIAKAKPEFLKITQTDPAKRSPGDTQRLSDYYRTEIAPQLNKTRQQIVSTQRSLKTQKPYTTVPVIKQLASEKYRKTFVQIRGNYMTKGDEVQPKLLSAFHAPKAKKDSPSRLDLANWLIDEQNPLTPRVIANRYWEKLFGIGLVSTSEEFGSQGELPTHPQLMDWLASELLRLDWDIKAYIKTIVMSASYRQSSLMNAEKLERDPINRLLTRGPRFRLSAEMVRDQALSVSGLLSQKMYGPPVKPPQPNMGLSAAFGGKIDWKTSPGEDRHRRGLYTNWRRSNPYPSMAAFDAPNRETCILNRDRTNTPLQAFVTLNDPVYVEAAQALGRRMESHSGNLEEQLKFGFRICTARVPTEKELNRLVKLYGAAKEKYQQDKSAAMLLATDPIGPLPKETKQTPADFAAWTLVSNVLLNLDEMLMVP